MGWYDFHHGYVVVGLQIDGTTDGPAEGERDCRKWLVRPRDDGTSLLCREGGYGRVG